MDSQEQTSEKLQTHYDQYTKLIIEDQYNTNCKPGMTP